MLRQKDGKGGIFFFFLHLNQRCQTDQALQTRWVVWSWSAGWIRPTDPLSSSVPTPLASPSMPSTASAPVSLVYVLWAAWVPEWSEQASHVAQSGQEHVAGILDQLEWCCTACSAHSSGTAPHVASSLGMALCMAPAPAGPGPTLHLGLAGTACSMGPRLAGEGTTWIAVPELPGRAAVKGNQAGAGAAVVHSSHSGICAAHAHPCSPVPECPIQVPYVACVLSLSRIPGTMHIVPHIGLFKASMMGWMVKLCGLGPVCRLYVSPSWSKWLFFSCVWCNLAFGLR